MSNTVDELLKLVDELQQINVIGDDDGRWNYMLELDAQIEEQVKTFPDVPYPESADIETIGFCRIPYMPLMYGRSLMTHPGYLRVAEPWRQAMAPCVAMIDEVEKAFAGMNGNGDSGVASRMFGTFLSWLNDHDSDVFVVCTANDVSKLPPEFSRSERFDGVFFLDLPGRDEKDAIWGIYRDLYEIDSAQKNPNDTNWTGAEIKSCCQLAALLDLPLKQAAQNVVPVAVTAAESVDRLRSWASGRCLSASESGIYRQTSGSPKTRRRMNREPSNN